MKEIKVWVSKGMLLIVLTRWLVKQVFGEKVTERLFGPQAVKR